MQTSPALRYILGDLLTHAVLPEMRQVVDDSGDGFFPRIRREKKRDLVRHVNHIFAFHGLLA